MQNHLNYKVGNNQVFLNKWLEKIFSINNNKINNKIK